MADRNSAGTAILAFLVGGVVGAGVALLFAPASGAETRRRIREAADDLRERTEELVEESRERIADLVSDGRERIEDLVTHGQESLSTLSANLRALVEEGRRAYRQRRDDLARAGEGELPQSAPADEGA
jgi:gas vesicle protein